MAIQANKPNNRVFLLLGVVLAALAFGGVLFALRQAGGGSTTSIVVAKTAITAGSQITSDQVTTAAVTVAPPDAFTDTTAVVGKTINISVGPNTQLVPAFFAAPALAPVTSGSGAAATVPISVETQVMKGYVAVAIPTAGVLPSGFTGAQQQTVSGELVSAGYYIQPGDHIDILVFTNNPPGAIRFSFQDVLVMRTGTAGTTSGASSVLLVEVPRSQSETLTALFTIGKPFAVKYVLRPQSEWGKAKPDGTYTPNYVSDAGPGVPAAPDTPVSAESLSNLFGH